jgi:hypothetical protein
LRFDRGVVHIVVACYIVDRYCFKSVIAVFRIAVVGNIVDHYCLRFDRGVVHIVVAVILLSITV